MADWFLLVTRRCLVDDLGFEEAAIDAPLFDSAVKNDIVQAFVDKRSNHPEGQETISGLRTNKIIFSLHVGEHRGATWFQKPVVNDAGIPVSPPVVWLLAARFHRSGKAEDAYPYFRDLDAKGRLLPTAKDVKAVLAHSQLSLAKSLLKEVPYLIKDAKESPGRIQAAVLGGRVSVRFLYEPTDPPMFTIAISQRLLPGPSKMPPNWLLVIAAAFLTSTPIESLSLAPDLGGSRLNPDEVAFCDFEA